MSGTLAEKLEVARHNFTQLRHAAIDGNFQFVKAQNVRTKEDVILVCIAQRVELPPLIVGAPNRIAHRLLPVAEFIYTEDFMHDYTLIDEEIKEIRPSAIALPDNVKSIDNAREARLERNTPEPPSAA